MPKFQEIVESLNHEAQVISMIPDSREKKELESDHFLRSWQFRREILSRSVSGELWKLGTKENT
jgi:hypothetical protein